MPKSLTPLDAALASLLHGVQAVEATSLPIAGCLGCIIAEMPRFSGYPDHDLAVVDGWALCSRDIVGASSYSPQQLARRPIWVDAGNAMPPDCDCVLDPEQVEIIGGFAEIFSEALPGQGVRRAGEEISARNTGLFRAGSPVRETDLLLGRVAGLEVLGVRRPRLRLVNVPGATGRSATSQFIMASARAAGAEAHFVEARARDAASIAQALSSDACDLIASVGGTGAGTADSAVDAFVRSGGNLIAHGVALRPGRTAAAGKLGAIPYIALPGSPDQAFAAWRCLALPAIDRLSAKRPEQAKTLPLGRKIASSIGLDEVVLVKEIDGVWMPLAVGELSLDSIAGADAWLVVAANSEGFAAGAQVGAFLL